MLNENAQPLVRPWNITPEQEQSFRSTDATWEWLFSLSGDSLCHYAGQWLAAKDCRIIATGETMDAMLAQLGDVDLQTVIMRRVDRPGWTIRR